MYFQETVLSFTDIATRAGFSSIKQNLVVFVNKKFKSSELGQQKDNGRTFKIIIKIYY